jgi:hypothetical protein
MGRSTGDLMTRARALAAAATLMLALPVAALALPDVGEEQNGLADTPTTPRAKATDPNGFAAWTYVSGARFEPGRTPPPGRPEGSVTPAEVDFLDVAMNGEDHAFAVGSIDVGDGERVPVIWRYRKDAHGDDVWEEVYRAPEDQPGYAARVVWADPETVIAVGGDGTFPDRETDGGGGYCSPGEARPEAQDPAGMGRVWVLRRGEPWRELTDDEMPDDVRALTALDSYYSANSDAKASFAVAGGLCQLWHFEDGAFLRTADGSGFAPPHDTETVLPKDLPPYEPVDPSRPTSTTGLGHVTGRTHTQLQARPSFRLRVRDISFADTTVVPVASRLVRVGAVTSGCCTPGNDQQTINPLVLTYALPTAPAASPATGTWAVEREAAAQTLSPSDAQPAGLPDSIYTLAHTQRSPTGAAPTSPPEWSRGHLHTSAREPSADIDRQPPSRWAAPSDPDAGVTTVRQDEFALSHPLTSMRLVDADGNVKARQFLDWGVGALQSTGQGVVLSTNPEQVPPPKGPADTASPCGTNASAECVDKVASWEPTSAERIDQSQRSFSLLKVPLYGLTAMDVWDEEGTGWAVGRHGAIARYSDGRSSTHAPGSAEPDPPETGAPADSSFPGGDLYDAFRTSTPPAAGEVPPLSSRPRVRSGAPRLIPRAVVPSGMRNIVMSEDGSEGWALAGGLMRYRDSEWRPCHHEGIDTRFEADPECDGVPAGDLTLLMRVPDPDGGLTVVAGTRAKKLFIFEDGSWKPHPDQPIDTWGNLEQGVFTSPGEAWLRAGNGVDRDQVLLHYDASKNPKWTLCTEPPALGSGVRKLAPRCGDPDGRLDFGYYYPVVGEAPAAAGGFALFTVPTPRIEGIAAADGHAYLYGWRVTRRGFRYPWIAVYNGEKWTADPALGGLDPGCPRIENRVCQDPVDTDPKQMGQVNSLALDTGNGLRGWAFGAFEEEAVRPASADTSLTSNNTTARYGAMRFREGEWSPLPDRGALRDYGSAGMSAWVGGDDVVLARGARLMRFHAPRERFELAEAGRRPFAEWNSQPNGPISEIAGSHGGAWAVVESQLYEYTDRPHLEVFEEVPHLIRQAAVTGSAMGADGSLWLSTASEQVYRHDRLTGWESLRIAGWDPGRLVTARSPAHAIAIGAGGDGLVVGARGRIARISGRTVRLDPAVGTVCDLDAPQPPCGTAKELRTAAVAPDGSGMVAGDRRALLWRPAGGDFRAIATPAVVGSVAFSAVSMPTPDRAWIGTSEGKIFAGTRDGLDWSWSEEARDADRRRVVIDRSLTLAPVTALTVRADGYGIAVARRGVIVERSASGEWQRAVTGTSANLFAVALNDDGGAVAGGERGMVLTRAGGRWQVARYPRAAGAEGDAAGVGLTAGDAKEDVEAWVVTSHHQGNRVWRYASSAGATPDRLRPLPDAPAQRPGELRFAAWGKTECHNRSEGEPSCREMNATDSYYETVVRRIVDELTRAGREGEIDGVLFTGDAIDNATHQGNHATGEPVSVIGLGPPLNGRKKLSRWREMVADRFDDAQVPFLQAVGGNDLAANQVCDAVNCTSLSRFAHAGENFVWRSIMNGRFGTGPGGPDSIDHAGRRFEHLPSEGTRAEDISAPGVQDPLPTGGGADTHFAVDVRPAGGGKPLMRVVFADTSMRSLSASDPIQQPAEPRGGQALWLERVLCHAPETTADGRPCTRAKGMHAVVVTNTPTYSYSAGALQTQPDGAAFETLVMHHDVSAVVTGRLGWNGVYWTLAPGLHTPCPGGQHPSGPPEGGDPCASTAGGGDSPASSIPGGEPLSAALGGLGAPASGDAPFGSPAAPEGFDDADAITGGTGLPVPFVVASGGGGKFASEAEADASTARGFWHGYSIVRIAASGNPGETIVEQRPVYDHIVLEAQERRLRPGQRMTLKGYGRGPVGYMEQQHIYGSRLDRINSADVTHRYDLVLADPERPHLPLEDANGDYVPVPARIAVVDRETGAVRARQGVGERTFAIGLLSVGDKVASYPLAFEPRRSFVAPRARVLLPPLPRAARAPAAQAPVRIAEPVAPPPTSPPASPSTPFSSQALQAPQPPTLPTLPAAQAPPTPQAPAPPSLAPPPPPPAPPPLPPQQQPQPLALGAKLQAVSIVPSVNPPAPPPVNPAPPGGAAARKEAKQRQAATAKSEEGASTGHSEAGEQTGDLAQEPPASKGAMTRRKVDRPEPSFSTLARPGQPSAWARGALYAGGLSLAALAFCAAWLIGRPTPRRRTPDLPAPAWSRVPRR